MKGQTNGIGLVLPHDRKPKNDKSRQYTANTESRRFFWNLPFSLSLSRPALDTVIVLLIPEYVRNSHK